MAARLLRPFAGVGRLVGRRPLSTTQLVEFCRSIRFFLASGMTVLQGMRSLAERGTPRVRRVAGELADVLADGWTLQDAMSKQGRRFPVLFLSLVAVGEETGKLPEVMRDLEKYYEHQQTQRRQLASQVMVPVIQYVMAVLVVAGLMLILGFVGGQKSSGGKKLQPILIEGPDGKRVPLKTVDANGVEQTAMALQDVPYDPLGWGMVGEQGAVVILIVGLGTPLALWLLVRLIRGVFRGGPFLDRVVLAVPFVGPAVRALAVARFAFGMNLMLDSSMSILRAIRLGFAATGNEAFAAAGPPAEAHLRRGNGITPALARARLFPGSFLSAAAVGEQTGHLPEVMGHQAEYYDDLSRRRMTALYTIAGYAVWLGVAVVIAVLVIKLFSFYSDTIMSNMGPKS